MAKDQHITPHNSKWQVKGAGNVRATRVFNTQKEAIDYAKDEAKKTGGNVIIHRPNGQIREKISYDGQVIVEAKQNVADKKQTESKQVASDKPKTATNSTNPKSPVAKPGTTAKKPGVKPIEQSDEKQTINSAPSYDKATIAVEVEKQKTKQQLKAERKEEKKQEKLKKKQAKLLIKQTKKLQKDIK